MTQVETREAFRMPIEYLKAKMPVAETIKQDLELDRRKDADGTAGLYADIMDCKTDLGRAGLASWSSYYTTDVDFLKDTQRLCKRYDRPMAIYDPLKLDQVEPVWNEIKDDDNFKHSFHFVEHSFAQMLNESPAAMEIISLYNLSSPVFSLLMPVFFLIIPFFILKFKGVVITVSKYMEVLQDIFSRHAIGKLFTLASDISWEQRLYVLVSVGFYCYQVYQNILCCTSFYGRMKTMHAYIFDLKDYAEYCIKKMDEFTKDSEDLKTYGEFRDDIKRNRLVMERLVAEVDKITPFSHNLSKLCEIGHTMTTFYHLHVDAEYDRAMRYSMGFVGYIDGLSALNAMYRQKRMAQCKFGKKECTFKGAYYAPLHRSKPVENSYSLKENMIITGPNAAGKTTLLKTTLFNIIISQQCGMGFYRKATIKPFDKLHCYLNIPDTSARDSLFQAEARRCKEIIDSVSQGDSSERHFCIFDELYSGTNPYEAVASSHSLLEYLSGTNCRFLLTTHFLELCQKLEGTNGVRNQHMGTTIAQDGGLKYEYKLKDGVSGIKGGLEILRGLDYPEAILEKAEESLCG